MNERAPESDSAEKASVRLGKVIATMPASNELAVLAEILIEQMKVVDAQHHVAMLMDVTDQRLTATVQALREETTQWSKLVGQARQSFVGELAAKAADQARQAATAEVADELARLRLALERRDPIKIRWPGTAPLSPRFASIPTAIAFCAGAVALWGALHLSHLLGL
ncbi:hypothetical protein WM40_25675 [Robbsia andropogonis]|uniref:Uncharacterized protein n=1 Tax=Robbsia andropogonis TaxID=28092 RepID=A0A0F5JTB0_9BURK|nr:hypothetical protein [Robbsia andropogonis]KKB61018.1 hypothetical protein WM40_25675 [Robbsia andropogonis]